MQSQQRILIVGGGITGLTAAYWLERKTNARITLLDPSSPGGKLRTERSEGFTLDLGPDSIFARKPGALELIQQLGMEQEVVEPQAKEFSIFTRGKLHRVPAGLASLASVSADAASGAEFLSAETKRRIAEPVAYSTEGDVSIAGFFRSRYGDEFSRIVAEPLLAGTHAGDPLKLSMQALYPAYLGSSEPATTAGPTFISFRSGMAYLPARLAQALTRTEVHLSAATSIGSGPVVETGLGPISADHVLLAIPSNLSAPLVESISLQAASEMRSIRHVSSAIVTLAYNRSDLNTQPEGTGFLVPADEDCPITGATWTSNKWPSRSPDDAFLVRVFLGRDGGADVTSLSEDELVGRARAGLLQTAGIQAEPRLVGVTQWREALPQYEIGHLGRVARIREALAHLPITVAGTSYDGVGIPDCIRQGRDAALSIVERLSS